MLMVDKSSSIAKVKTKAIVTLIVMAAVITPLLLILISHNDRTRSDRNLEIIREAIKKKDPSVCDDIQGGIMEQKPPDTTPGGPDVVSRTIPERTEVQVKAECKEDVQRVQGIRQHEDE